MLCANDLCHKQVKPNIYYKRKRFCSRICCNSQWNRTHPPTYKKRSPSDQAIWTENMKFSRRGRGFIFLNGMCISCNQKKVWNVYPHDKCSVAICRCQCESYGATGAAGGETTGEEGSIVPPPKEYENAIPAPALPDSDAHRPKTFK